MNGLPYYKRYARDFIEGTVGLSFEAKGAYSILLDLIYLRNGDLPDDDRYVSGHLGLSVRKWRTIKNALIEAGKISIESGIILNKRADKELIISRKYQEKQAENRRDCNKNNDLQKPALNHSRVNTDTDNNKKKKIPKKKSETPRDVLETILTPEMAENVLEHRNRMRKPLTSFAASRLVAEFSKAADPNEAAAVMIESGWQAFKIDWLKNRTPQKAQSATEADWQKRIDYYQQTGGEWGASWGPKPFEAGCRVPAQFLPKQRDAA